MPGATNNDHFHSLHKIILRANRRCSCLTQQTRIHMKSKRVFLLSIIGSPLILFCLAVHSVTESGTQSSNGQELGSFSISSKIFGDQTFAPLFCTAGDRQFFLGGDFKDQSSSLVLRLVVDPLNGPVVRLFSSETNFEKSVIFHRSDCRVFHFSLDSTGWRINDIEDYRFTLQLECSRVGESIIGIASTTHCH
jgi:hypothetical protein